MDSLAETQMCRLSATFTDKMQQAKLKSAKDTEIWRQKLQKVAQVKTELGLRKQTTPPSVLHKTICELEEKEKETLTLRKLLKM